MAMVAGQSGGLGFWVPGAWSSQSVLGGEGGVGERTIGVFGAHALPYSCLPSGDIGAGGGG